MLRKFFPAVRGYGRQSLGASFMIILEGVLEIMIPFYMTKLINEGIDVAVPNINIIIITTLTI